MARTVQVPGAGNVKIINPWLAFLLSAVTCGVYYVFWYGLRNAELSDYGSALPKEGNPLVVGSVGPMLAITAGVFLIVPPFVSELRFFGRIRWAQEHVGVDERVSQVAGVLLFALGLFLVPFEVAYAQGQLNRLWQHASRIPDTAAS
jgi:hypothetical protein